MSKQKKVWRTHDRWHRYDVIDGELRIKDVHWRNLLWPLWRWLTTPWRYYLYWKHGE